MASASEGRDWARSSLRGIIDTLYTPFAGLGGEEIDEDAYRTLVRHCIGVLGHDGIWVAGLTGELWALSTDERKRLLEIGIAESRSLKSDALIEACSASTNIVETVELTNHAADAGADICYLIPPYFEAKGYEPTRLLFKYVTERSDIALGLFNTHAGGWFLSPRECADLVAEFPAICAVKNGMFRPSHSSALHRLRPDLVIWECDMIAYRAGFLRRGVAAPGILAGVSYLYDVPGNQLYTEHWNLIMEDKISEAIDFWYDSGLDDLVSSLHENFGPATIGSAYTHWGSAFKASAAELGLPPGNYPHSRVPQEPLPESNRLAIRAAYEKIGYTPPTGRADTQGVSDG